MFTYYIQNIDPKNIHVNMFCRVGKFHADTISSDANGYLRIKYNTTTTTTTTTTNTTTTSTTTTTTDAAVVKCDDADADNDDDNNNNNIIAIQM